MQPYLTDLSDEQWSLIEEHIPGAKTGGRPRKTDVRRVVDAILYLVRTGCQWRNLPHDFPPWQTVYRYFADWQRRGVVRRVHRALYRSYRFSTNCGLKGPSSLVLDSQSVKTGKAGGERGYDGGKRVKGRKRQLLVDSQGMPVEITVTAANVHDTKGGQRVITKAARWIKVGLTDELTTVYADSGYSGPAFANAAQRLLGAVVKVSGSLAAVYRRFVPVAHRWVVERTFAWLGDYRRLDKDHEHYTNHSVAMVRWAAVRMFLVRLTRW